MERFISKETEIFLSGSIAEYTTSIEMDRLINVGDESIIITRTLYRYIIYLGELMREFTPFPANDTLRPLDFFFPLPFAVSLLLAP